MAESKPKSEIQILVVDDEPSLIMMLGMQLKRLGYQPQTFTDPLAARGHIESCECDILLTDQMMPGMSGDELAVLFKEKHPEGRCVLLSGNGDELRSRGVLPAGVNHVATKPIGMDELETLLERFSAETAGDLVIAG